MHESRAAAETVPDIPGGKTYTFSHASVFISRWDKAVEGKVPSEVIAQKLSMHPGMI